eukprot:TRINITY_DN107375_c0_g1_i1.p2 TRINITY_DN107375_c0_g1~~TRINITY_DN107375_c0_g1_i1.p2  ORF type:complete len:142 (-),score=32.56 TRINITY_DN107375_c0_g1_i1:156-581(-)
MAAVKGKVLGATGLKNVDLWGKSDPFVVVTLVNPDGTELGTMKTSTKTDDLDPKWDDENFNFGHDGDDFLECNLVFKIWDTGLGPDVELGQAIVPVALVPLLEEGKQPVVFEFSLGIKKGKTSLGHIMVAMGVVPHAGWFS